MTFEVETGGTRRVVDARREGNCWRVMVDGREVRVDAAQVAKRWSLIIGPPEGGVHAPEVAADSGLHGTSYEVSIETLGPGDLVVHVNARAIPVAVTGNGWARRRRPHAASAGGADVATVVAPMPGRIVKLLVRPGDAVAARQGVIVIEAMKMENELRAPTPGTVREVRVTEGDSVEAGATLIVLE